MSAGATSPAAARLRAAAVLARVEICPCTLLHLITDLYPTYPRSWHPDVAEGKVSAAEFRPHHKPQASTRGPANLPLEATLH